MEIARFFRAMERLGVEIPGFMPILVVALIVFSAVLFAKIGRKKSRAAQSPTTALSARLAEIDPADYDFDGNKKQGEEPSVDFDKFFSNTERQDELKSAK